MLELSTLYSIPRQDSEPSQTNKHGFNQWNMEVDSE